MSNYNFDPRGKVYCEDCHQAEAECSCTELQKLRQKNALMSRQIRYLTNEITHSRNIIAEISELGTMDPTRW